MLSEVKKIIELTSKISIDFITLKDEKEGVRCLFFSTEGTYKFLLIRKEPLVKEIKSFAIANIIYGNQATMLLRRLHKWTQA